MAKIISEAPQESKKAKYKYVTLVLKYYDKGLKNSYDVTEVITSLLNTLKSYNQNCSYDDYKFDLYGVCVDEETDLADSKNDYIKSIESSEEE